MTIPSISRSLHLAAVGGALQLTRVNRPIDKPAAGQVLIRMGAASLNCRDLLTLQDPASNHDGLVPLSDGAGTVAAIGGGVNRWHVGDRVSVNFFPTWRAGAFSPTILATAPGGGQTDGMPSRYGWRTASPWSRQGHRDLLIGCEARAGQGPGRLDDHQLPRPARLGCRGAGPHRRKGCGPHPGTWRAGHLQPVHCSHGPGRTHGADRCADRLCVTAQHPAAAVQERQHQRQLRSAAHFGKVVINLG